MNPEQACASRVSDVVVHARGALVTRRVALPAALPDGELDLVVEGLTLLADAGSLRATLDGSDREIVAVTAALHVPATPATVGASVERVRAVEQRKERLVAEAGRLAAQRTQLTGLALAPRLARATRASKPDDVAARVEQALAASALAGEVLAQIDARFAELEIALRQAERDLEDARLADAYTAASVRAGAGKPTRRVIVRLAGDGPVGGLALTYMVGGARWWPVYALRITDQREGGARAEWWHEALVAQLSGEDWSGVNLSLSTADLVHDARLPELPALRLGRAQPAPRRGYRAPPAGLDAMYAGYDRAFRDVPPPRTWQEETSHVIDALLASDANVAPSTPQSRPVVAGGYPMPSAAPMMQTRAGVMREEIASSFGAEPAPMMAQAPAPGGRPMAKTAGATAKGGAAAKAMMIKAEEAPPAAEEPTTVEPSDAWLDFDALTLAPAEDRARRGRLVLARPGATARVDLAADAAARIEQLMPRGALTDPTISRGLFDHVYPAGAPVDVPADGVTHRLTIAVGAGTPTVRFRTVPREAAEVYREATMTNPFASPLLAGPVEVYFDGSLLVTSGIDRIDAGGSMTVGLGVEERLRVARNARVAEDTTGLLGGTAVIEHTVTVDLTSSLGAPARVEILDRLPVTDDKDLKIELTAAKPEAKPYLQVERGTPLRKGLTWTVEVPAAGKARVEYQYRLAFAAKSEIAGGNRRE